MIKVQHQGSLDGLCGMYALVHAFHVGGNSDNKAAFRIACSSISKSRWPEVLWRGTNFIEMKKMTKRCLQLLELDNLSVTYPFEEEPPKTTKDYWARFDSIFSEEEPYCAIIGIEKPMQHWTVVGGGGGRVKILDSTSNSSLQQKNRVNMVLSSRNLRKGQWMLAPDELIVFSRCA